MHGEEFTDEKTCLPVISPIRKPRHIKSKKQQGQFAVRNLIGTLGALQQQLNSVMNPEIEISPICCLWLAKTLETSCPTLWNQLTKVRDLVSEVPPPVSNADVKEYEQ